MNIKEAKEWLQGIRSMTNIIPCDPLETWDVRIAEADAAMTQQAYWIVKAHIDGVNVPAIPEGYALMPIEPTIEMRKAANMAYMDWVSLGDKERDEQLSGEWRPVVFSEPSFTHADSYKAMIEAAQKGGK